MNKQINKLIDNENRTIFLQKNIQSEILRFYSELYRKNEVIDIDLDTILDYSDVPKLTDFLSQSLEGQLTMEEVFQSLSSMKNCKSPGLDGYTVEFFKHFWKDISFFLLRYLNFAFMSGRMSEIHKLGVISLIPKNNKERLYLRNWRLISLLNVTYKIASACIANRLKKVLPFLINENQKGFMEGRFIGENIRLLYDLLLYTDVNDIPGLLLLIDFEKAFDSISHHFIIKVLQYFKFGPSIIRWFSVFYENIQSCIVVNGHLTPRFRIERGCRQGDPLSSYIFLLCAEILGIMFRKSRFINGISISEKKLKLIQYADDTLLTLNGTFSELNVALSILDEYASISGLKINIHKTRAIWIGRYKHKKDILIDRDLTWVFDEYFKYLGVDFCTNLQEMVHYNYREKIMEIRSQMTSWLKRYLTVLGRVTVVKSLLISKLNYLIMSLPNPSDKVLKELNSLFYNFIWEEKPDKVCRNQMSQKYIDGGVKMIDIYAHCQSLKISWIRRIVKGSIDSYILCFLIASLPRQDDVILYMTCMGNHYFRELSKQTYNIFWSDMFSAYSYFLTIHYNNHVNVSSQPIWNNDNIKIGNLPIYMKKWCQKGVRFINDILDEEGRFLSLKDFQNIYDVRSNFLFLPYTVCCYQENVTKIHTQ